MFYQAKIITLLLLTTAVLEGRAKLTLSKECGEVVCPEHNFCSPTDHVCRPCETICNSGLGNHDQNRCEEDCQDYLHDEIYAKKGISSAIRNIENEVFILKILVIATLGVTAAVLIILIALFITIKHRRNRSSKKAAAVELPAVIYNNKYEKSITTPIRKSSMDNNNDFRRADRDREPSESTLPEYSYDNPTMLPSPSHHV